MSARRERYRELFVAELAERGLVAEKDGIVGTVPTPVGPRRVRVLLAEAFPYRRPIVYSLEAGARRRHQDPETGELCLWPGEGAGWDPQDGSAGLLERIAEWFEHDANGSWPEGDRPPDLHLSIGRTRPGLVLTGNDWPPRGAWGRFSARSDGAVTLVANALSGNQTKSLDDEHPLAKRYLLSKCPSEVGFWFRLTREPVAPRQVSDIATILHEQGVLSTDRFRNELRGLVGKKIRTSTRLTIALLYPDPDASRAHEERTLFVDAMIAPGSNLPAIFNTNIYGRAMAPADDAALVRRRPPDARLASAKVAVFGAGTLGSQIALSLARVGAGNLALFDGDVLRPGHVIRHAAPHYLVGATKTEATELTIAGYVPMTRVSRTGATWDIARLTEATKTSQIVLDAAATPTYTMLLAEICLASRVPLVSVVALRSGSIGRVRMLRPDQDPCPECYRRVEDLEVRFPTDATFVEGGCGDLTSIASPLDLEMTAMVATREVVRLLEGEPGPSELFIINRPAPDMPPPFDCEGIVRRTHRRAEGCGLCAA